MNIIETAKAILQGEDIDPMEVVRAVARLEPVAWCYTSVCGQIHTPYSSEYRCRMDSERFGGKVSGLYTLEADK